MSDKRPSAGSQVVDELKRVSLESSAGNESTVRIKPHSAVIHKNKSSTSRVDTHYLAPIFSGHEEH